VPPISPYLDDLLTRWIARGNTLRKEAVFQKELIEPLSLVAHGNRLATRERRRRDVRRLEESVLEAQTRWDERLHRIEVWGKAVADLQQEEARLQRLIRSTLWLQKARRHQETFARRLEHRADRLHAEQQVLHEKLEAWLALLQEREGTLQELIDKQEKSVRPLYVSRARKQPEVDFVNAQQAASGSLGKDLHHLRRSLAHVLGRLQKAFSTVEIQASGSELLYEMHKQEIVTTLKDAEKILQERREQILSDALVYEACRNLLRRLHETAHGLRCIEDIPQTKHGWRKFFHIN
jgi:hypothetical protein